MKTPREIDTGEKVGGFEEREQLHSLPEITHLQFLVLDTLLRYSHGISATMLRATLRHNGEDREGPKFYQMMRRLEQSGLVESWQKQFKVDDGGEVVRTYYQTAQPGRIAWQLTLEFYSVRIKANQILRDTRQADQGGKKRAESCEISDRVKK